MPYTTHDTIQRKVYSTQPYKSQESLLCATIQFRVKFDLRKYTN